MAAALLRMDESLFLQDAQVVRRNPIPQAESVPQFRERGPRILLDGLVQQKAGYGFRDLL